MELKLLNYQKEDIFKILVHERHDPDEFRWEERRRVHTSHITPGFPTLVHQATGHYFELRSGQHGRINIRYSPALQLQVLERWDADWDTVTDHVASWATILRRELKSVDPWLEARRQRASLVAARSVGNEHFTQQELIRIRESVGALGDEIRRTQRLNKIQTDLILGAIEDSAKAAERIGRKDWIMLLVGQLVSAISEAGIDGDTARHLLAATGAVLSWVTQVVPSLPSQ